MNYVNLYGGLGNQIFQYVFGKFALSEQARYICDFELPRSIDGKLAIERFFKIKIDCAAVDELSMIGIPKNKFIRKFIGKLGNISIFKRFNTDSRFDLKSKFGYYHGYWQQLTFFSTRRDDVLALLKLNDIPAHAIYQDLLYLVQSEHTLVIHVRKGDYKLWKNRRIFTWLGPEFYSLAIAGIITDKIKRIVVLTNDRDWVQSELLSCLSIFGCSVLIPLLESGLTDMHDFSLLMNSKNLLISNSTFAWWAAYLNTSGTIFAPKPWYRRIDCKLQVDSWNYINVPARHKF